MRNPIEIDYSHSRAIIQGIGERLRTLLKEDRELPVSLRLQLDRLRQLEGEPLPNVERPTTRWWARRPADAKLRRLREGRKALPGVPLTEHPLSCVHLLA